MIHTQTRQAIDPRHARGFDTTELREEFLIESPFVDGEINLVYSHYDRMIVGGAVPAGGALTLDTVAETGTPRFLDRREATVVNIGEPGTVQVGGETHELGRCDMLYVGMGSGDIVLSGDGARFYLLSAPAHRNFPTRLITIEDAVKVPLGTREAGNERVINQFVHPAVMESCQLVIGMTQLASGSIWNTMPAHVHDRRSEAYLYLDLPDDARIMHFMGEPDETRHLVMKNEQAVLSPPWSIHAGAGTSAYSFIWCMAGDNVDYTDVEMVAMDALR